jgi:hypothetical protein
MSPHYTRDVDKKPRLGDARDLTPKNKNARRNTAGVLSVVLNR